MKKVICLLLMAFSVITTGIHSVSAVKDQEFIEIIKEKFKYQNANDYINIDFNYNFDSEKYKYMNFVDWIDEKFNGIDGFINKLLILSNNGLDQTIKSENPLDSWAMALFAMCSNIDLRINNSKNYLCILKYYIETEYKYYYQSGEKPLNESIFKICNGFWKVCNEIKPLIDKLYNDKKEICEINMKSLESFLKRINL